MCIHPNPKLNSVRNVRKSKIKMEDYYTKERRYPIKYYKPETLKRFLRAYVHHGRVQAPNTA